MAGRKGRAREGLEVARLKYELGMATQAEVLAAESTVASLEAQLENLKWQHAMAVKAFYEPWAWTGGGAGFRPGLLPGRGTGGRGRPAKLKTDQKGYGSLALPRAAARPPFRVGSLCAAKVLPLWLALPLIWLSSTADILSSTG